MFSFLYRFTGINYGFDNIALIARVSSFSFQIIVQRQQIANVLKIRFVSLLFHKLHFAKAIWAGWDKKYFFGLTFFRKVLKKIHNFIPISDCCSDDCGDYNNINNNSFKNFHKVLSFGGLGIGRSTNSVDTASVFHSLKILSHKLNCCRASAAWPVFYV